MTRHGHWLPLFLCFALAGCATAGAGQDARAEIEGAAARWAAGFNSGSADELAALYTPDALLLPPNVDVMRGHEAIRSYFVSAFGQGKVSISLQGDEFEQSGDIAYRIGTFRVTVPGGQEVDRGKFMEIWRRTPAGWRIQHDIWNSSMAPSAPVPQ